MKICHLLVSHCCGSIWGSLGAYTSDLMILSANVALLHDHECTGVLYMNPSWDINSIFKPEYLVIDADIVLR